MKSYAGIGSRATPKEVQVLFDKIAIYLAKKDYVLRSGAADGSDKAFEIGCDKIKGKKEIYIPWQGFNGSDSKFILKDEKAYEIAMQYHPNWTRLSEGAKKLQARNSHQVLGNYLNDPVDFVLCWTKDKKGEGGTGQALRIAKAYKIPIFDAGGYQDTDIIWFEMLLFVNDIISTKNKVEEA